MADNRSQFRIDLVTKEALAKAEEKWPLLNKSELLRKIVEQWNQAQELGFSKTQKLVEIQQDTRNIQQDTHNIQQDTRNILYQMVTLREEMQELSDRLTNLESRVEEHGF